MDDKVIDYKIALNEELYKLNDAIQPYLNHNDELQKKLSDIQAIYKEKIKNTTPKIMVYGIYNAGKSSIINELVRADVAKVADSPTTDKVECYPWQGYEISDTPGVGAPIEHEKITTDAIRKADVVLFVMSTTGSVEKKENYSRMKEISDSGKKIIIVLNDKDGMIVDKDGQDILFEIEQKVYDNMQKIGIDDVNNRFIIVTVNAQLAKVGRESNDSSFWETSKMGKLETVILTELKRTTTFKVLRNAIKEIINSVRKIEENINGTQENEELVGEFTDILTQLRSEKQRIRKDMKAYIENRTNRIVASLPDKIWAVRENQDNVNNVVRAAQQEVVDSVREKLQNELMIVEDEMKKDVSLLQAKFTQMEMNINGNINVDKTDGGEIKNIDGNGIVREKDIIKDMVLGIAEGKVATDVALQILKELGVKGGVGKFVFKKLGGETLVKAVPILAKIPVLPLQTIIIGYTIMKKIFGDDGGYERAKAKAEQEAAYARAKADAESHARQRLQQDCIYMAEDLGENLVNWVNQALQQTLGVVENEITEKINQSGIAQSNIMSCAQRLSDIEDRYHRIELDLGKESV